MPNELSKKSIGVFAAVCSLVGVWLAIVSLNYQLPVWPWGFVAALLGASSLLPIIDALQAAFLKNLPEGRRAAANIQVASVIILVGLLFLATALFRLPWA